MKTNCYYFYLLLVSLFCWPAHAAKASAAADSAYQEAMRTALLSLDATETNYLPCRNQFERVAQMYPDEWLPVYYMAYCDLQMVFVKVGATDTQPQLDEAKNLLEKLETAPGADPSEVSTLWGYYYMAIITLDAANGQKYFPQAIAAYEKAIALNPDNPRPVCLLAFFKQFLPAFMRSDQEIAEGREKAIALFEKESLSTEKPHWGAFFLNMIQQ
ncbi:MAG: tetratricopeptide repeat protein [Tannerellaceae bacterium]|jgi:tetratricopeptide (TPR) repeat protein|nr:tetratricopeptide repeat protein [Tannerellaceae bacterium]